MRNTFLLKKIASFVPPLQNNLHTWIRTTNDMLIHQEIWVGLGYAVIAII